MKNNFFRLILGALLVVSGFSIAQNCALCKKTIKRSVYTAECNHVYHKRCFKQISQTQQQITCSCCNAVIKPFVVVHTCDAMYRQHGGKLLVCCGIAGVYALLYSITFGSMQVCNGGPSSSSACQWDTIMHQ